MEKTEWEALLRRRLAQELAGEHLPEGWLWWLSYVDPDKSALAEKQAPYGPGFLGVVVLYAPGPVYAATLASSLGVNPGGEVAIFPVPAADVPVSYRNRLLSRAELAKLGSLPSSSS